MGILKVYVFYNYTKFPSGEIYIYRIAIPKTQNYRSRTSVECWRIYAGQRSPKYIQRHCVKYFDRTKPKRKPKRFTANLREYNIQGTYLC